LASLFEESYYGHLWVIGIGLILWIKSDGMLIRK